MKPGLIGTVLSSSRTYSPSPSRKIVTVSAFSTAVSLRIGIVNVFVVSPSANVSVPLVAV